MRIEIPADHAFAAQARYRWRPGIFHNHIAVARGTERGVQPSEFPLHAPPFRNPTVIGAKKDTAARSRVMATRI